LPLQPKTERRSFFNPSEGICLGNQLDLSRAASPNNESDIAIEGLLESGLAREEIAVLMRDASARHSRFPTLFREAQRHLAARSWAECYTRCRHALDAVPFHVDCMVLAAESLAQLGHTSLAECYLRSAYILGMNRAAFQNQLLQLGINRLIGERARDGALLDDIVGLCCTFGTVVSVDEIRDWMRAGNSERDIVMVLGKAKTALRIDNPRSPVNVGSKTLEKIWGLFRGKKGEAHSEVMPAAAGVGNGRYPLGIMFAYEATSSPSTVEGTDDTRNIAIGFRSVHLLSGQGQRTLASIDFRDEASVTSTVTAGFANVESWGTWSIGNRSGIILWPQPIPDGDLTIALEAATYAPGFASLRVSVFSTSGYAGALDIDTSNRFHYVTLKKHTSFPSNNTFLSIAKQTSCWIKQWNALAPFTSGGPTSAEVEHSGTALNPDDHQATFANQVTSTGVPVVLQLDYADTASPAMFTVSDDSRQIAIGFRSIELVDPDSGAPLAAIDFTSAGNAREHILFGFSHIENWGTWSLGKTSGLLCWLPASKLQKIDVVLTASTFAAAFANLRVDLKLSSGYVGSVIVAADGQRQVAPLAMLQNNEAELFFGSSISSDDVNNVSLASSTPLVSVIILNFNKPVLSSLSALSATSAGIAVPYEVLIVDNGSSQENWSALQKTRVPFRLVRNTANRYFGEGNNLGAQQARGKYLLFLNNDAFLMPGTVEKLLEVFANHSNCGVSGPVFRYPDKRLQEAGGFIRPSGDAWQRGKAESEFDLASLPEYEVVDYISAACILMPADLFASVGGFNYRFDPAYYEDVDLCLRVRLRGKATILARDATCLHIENATTSDKKNNSGASNAVKHNKEIFLSVWGNYLRDRTDGAMPKALMPPLPTRPLAQASQAPVSQATYSPFPLSPGGGERYLLATALAMSEFGNTAFVTPDAYSTLRLDNILFDLGLPIGNIQTCDVRNAARAPLERFVIMGNEVFPRKLLPAKRKFFVCQFPFPLHGVSNVELADGLQRLTKFEKVIVYSSFAKNAYISHLNTFSRSANVCVVAPAVGTSHLVGLREKREPWILSIGRFTNKGHAKRQDVLIEALKRASPAVRNGWKLILCGVVPNDARDYFAELQASVGETINVEFVLSPTRATLDSLLAKSSVYAHATGFGVESERDYWKCEHFGITMVEALAAGCRVLCYELGGGPEIISHAEDCHTFGSLDELSAHLENITVGEISPATRERIGNIYGDAAFASAMRATLQ
jgi:O-antigen biosynthesis protein